MSFEVPSRISGAAPDPARLAEIRGRFAKAAAPVRLLPSNAAMMLLALGLFVVLSILFTVPVGFRGFAKLSAGQAVIEYSLLLLLALVLAGGVAGQMIPGSRRIVPPVTSVILAIVLLSVTAAMLFPDFGTRDFVRRGIPCLRLGLLCAIPGAGLTWAAMRRGFIVSPVGAAVAAGAMSGLLGIGVLALHCPIFEAAHIVAWHVGVIAVTSLAGAFSGWIFSRAGWGTIPS
jgi:hypothetical protein